MVILNPRKESWQYQQVDETDQEKEKDSQVVDVATPTLSHASVADREKDRAAVEATANDKDKFQHTGHHIMDHDEQKLIANMRRFQADHKPDGYPPVRMGDISILCDMVEGAVPSIDLLQTRLENGEELRYQDGAWWLFDKAGNGRATGITLRGLLQNLIWLDC